MKYFKIFIGTLLMLVFYSNGASAAEIKKTFSLVKPANLELNLVESNSSAAVYSTDDYQSGVFDQFQSIIQSHDLPNVLIDNNLVSRHPENILSSFWKVAETYTIQLKTSVDVTGVYYGHHLNQGGPEQIKFYDENDTLLFTHDTSNTSYNFNYVILDVKNVKKVTVQKARITYITEFELFIDPTALYASVFDLSATPIDHESARIKWKNPGDNFLNGNDIYLNDVYVTSVNSASDLSYIFTDLEPETEYKVTVSANYNGIQVKKSITFTTPKDTTPPKNARDLLIKQQKKSIILNWTNTDDVDFSHVKIFKNGKLWKDKVTDLSIVDNDVEYGRTYYYKVVSVDLNGNGSNGITSKSIKMIEPKLDVTNLKAIAPDYTKVELSWKNPTVEGFEKVTIYRKAKATGLLNKVITLLVDDYELISETNGTVFKDLTVTENTTYEYKVTTTINGEETTGVITQVTTPVFQVIKPELGKDNNGDFLLTWELPEKGKVRIIIDGKEFAVVNAADKQKLIPASNMKYDVIGNPRLDLIKIVPIDENGNEGAIVKPARPGGGNGAVGGLDIVTSTGINAVELLKMGIGLLGLVGVFVLLGLSFPVAKRLIVFLQKKVILQVGYSKKRYIE